MIEINKDVQNYCYAQQGIVLNCNILVVKQIKLKITGSKSQRQEKTVVKRLEPFRIPRTNFGITRCMVRQSGVTFTTK